MSLKLFLFILISFKLFAWDEHIRPMPYLPKAVEPVKAVDIVSFSLLPQIHKRLFTLNNENLPIPEVVEDFNVSNDQKTYTFQLKNLNFHSGRKLKADDVVYSINNAIKGKVSGYIKLLNIKDIIGNNSKHSVVFKLKKVDPSFLFHLTDLRLAIVYRDSGSDGLGPYKVVKNTKNSIKLELVEKINKKIPKIVTYQLSTRDEAIKGFIKGNFHDLALYPIKNKDLKGIKDFAKVNKFHFPRTYGLFLNSRRLKRQYRETLFQVLNWNKVVDTCYKGDQKAFSIVPPGFTGFLESKLTEDKKLKCEFDNKLRIFIPRGLGGEDCLYRYFKAKLSKCNNLSLEMVNFNQVIEGWTKNSIDGYFGYVEAESDIDFFGNFLPSAPFSLGLPKDDKLVSLLNKYNTTFKELAREESALKIAAHLTNIKTMIPLYYESLYLITSKRYRPIHLGVRSASMISFKDYIGEK